MNEMEQRAERLLERTRACIVDDWRRAPHWLSVQIHAAALGYLGLYEIMPALDPTIAKLLPSPLQGAAIGTYALLAIVARLVAQRQPNA